MNSKTAITYVEGVPGKVCQGCGMWLPLSCFRLRAECLGGRQVRCLNCQRGYENDKQSRRRQSGFSDYERSKMLKDLVPVTKCLICGKKRHGRGSICQEHRGTGRMGCNSCAVRDACKARVLAGQWLYCEEPDIADIQREEEVA